MGARQGGSIPEGVAAVLHYSNSGGLALWGRDVGLNAADGEGPGRFPVQGWKEDHGETTVAKEVQDLDIPATGGDNERGGNGGDTDFNSPEAEYGRAIYCNAANSRPMQAGHLAARYAVFLAVVVIDGDIPEGSARKGSVSSGGNGVGVRGRAGQGRGRRRRGGVPGSEWLQWSGVERIGVEWSGVERSGAEWSGAEDD